MLRGRSDRDCAGLLLISAEARLFWIVGVANVGACAALCGDGDAESELGIHFGRSCVLDVGVAQVLDICIAIMVCVVLVFLTGLYILASM